MTSRLEDRLRQPLPGRDGKRFRDVSLIEQHEIIFRFLEELYDEVLEVKNLLRRHHGREGD
ncbi:MAG: hypothetical protein RIB97_13145 [Nitratireductor sp.]